MHPTRAPYAHPMRALYAPYTHARILLCTDAPHPHLHNHIYLQVAIAGGDRTIGTSDSFVVDACASHDPDEPNVACDGGTRTCSSGITFDWRCALVLANSTQASTDVLAGVLGTSACGLSLPSNSTCAWAFDGGTLAAGSYVLGARISNTGSGEAALSAVRHTMNRLQGLACAARPIPCKGMAARPPPYLYTCHRLHVHAGVHHTATRVPGYTCSPYARAT